MRKLIILKDNIEYQCRRCEESYTTSLHDLNFIFQVDSNRDMGPEYAHSATIEETCRQCKDYLSIDIDVYEYPAGVIGHVDVQPYRSSILTTADPSEWFTIHLI